MMAVLICEAAFCVGAKQRETRILIIGDSLTEGYGVAPQYSYPSLLQKKFEAIGKAQIKVVNAGTSGATSAFGIKTLTFHIKHSKPDLLILCLGANDGLRGIAPLETEKNLSLVLSLAKENGIKSLLIGMKAPPNYGIKFPKEFSDLYPRLASLYNIPLVPFLLEGVAGEPSLNQADGIHPNQKGYEIVTDYVFSHLKGFAYE